MIASTKKYTKNKQKNKKENRQTEPWTVGILAGGYNLRKI